jgi:hypothetical protein
MGWAVRAGFMGEGKIVQVLDCRMGRNEIPGKPRRRWQDTIRLCLNVAMRRRGLHWCGRGLEPVSESAGHGNKLTSWLARV